jgi:hypothetical protein
MEFGRGEPVGFFLGALVTVPAYQIEQLALAEPSVIFGFEDFGNLVLDVPVDFNRGWGRLLASGEGIGCSGLDLGDVEHRVNRAHGLR